MAVLSPPWDFLRRASWPPDSTVLVLVQFPSPPAYSLWQSIEVLSRVLHAMWRGIKDDSIMVKWPGHIGENDLYGKIKGAKSIAS